MSATDRKYIGGLMRCCLLSIDEAPAGREGDVIGCRFHDDPDEPQAKFTDGAWRWVGPNYYPETRELTDPRSDNPAVRMNEKLGFPGEVGP